MPKLAIVILLSIAAPALADPKTEVKAHVDRATAHHAAGKFADALVELKAAYEIDPQAGLLYAIAQVHVKLDQCGDAIVFYRKFLATRPDAKPSAAAREAITACDAKLASQPKPAPEPIAKPAVEPAGPSTRPDVEPERPSRPRAWYKDPIGGALVGVGVAGGVVGVLFYRSAQRDIDAAPSAADYGGSEELIDRAGGKRTKAVIAGVAGLALAGAGVVRYVMIRGRAESSVAVVPTAGGAAISWGGRF